MKTHQYRLQIEWTGNKGSGTSAYTAYERAHEISVDGKPGIPASSDPSFRGDKTRYNPEELLVASLSSCHMLWYLHLCAQAGVTVVAYEDLAKGTMTETDDGGGHFTEVMLCPVVTVSEEQMIGKAMELHGSAHSLCFIARSVNFPVRHQPQIKLPNG
ncbi:OsmC family protein [Sediminibacterium soli]|uniref:OsmC family protein n=1 Tax=Sediminibacterium soli TaxID=2698829 RepID=UPI00137AA749|nr:OsmC family protein [Sediminibacterium soli]NCI47106.1 OsmC family peroxiredoxin [Sediminibacterium soli]